VFFIKNNVFADLNKIKEDDEFSVVGMNNNEYMD
jgi:hypothetical protein